nr:1-aminocyclopropane-1-carboxylate synthase 11-like [Ipomoea batatas]
MKKDWDAAEERTQNQLALIEDDDIDEWLAMDTSAEATPTASSRATSTNIAQDILQVILKVLGHLVYRAENIVRKEIDPLKKCLAAKDARDKELKEKVKALDERVASTKQEAKAAKRETTETTIELPLDLIQDPPGQLSLYFSSSGSMSFQSRSAAFSKVAFVVDDGAIDRHPFFFSYFKLITCRWP